MPVLTVNPVGTFKDRKPIIGYSDTKKWSFYGSQSTPYEMDGESIQNSFPQLTEAFEPLEPISDSYWICQESAYFDSLVEKWHFERDEFGSVQKMIMCKAYQKIIAMGNKAIPNILRKLEQEGEEPDFWFWALNVLTDVDPLTDDIRGNIKEMAKCWLGWARGKYVW